MNKEEMLQDLRDVKTILEGFEHNKQQIINLREILKSINAKYSLIDYGWRDLAIGLEHSKDQITKKLSHLWIKENT